ncbi:hypothetical protein ASO20_00160 [Mycoplasma sp. (ex Biomphalaria glabrata)]|nr:NCS2 family permease [Mycoplasma sp. (ex Biomphalaria glabrata)]ALV23094.1 hypothetical protein ASO20_00160 [Mycoplasma sp. (ex Biomphalaria glabrata)]
MFQSISTIKYLLKKDRRQLRFEIIGGITTFLSMVYIVFVNPSILLGAYHPTDNEVSSVKFALFFATVVVSFLGTLLIGLFADVPIGMAPGMGLNAFFAFTLVGKLLGNVPNALDIALSSSIISGVLFTVIGITPLRKIIVDVIPRDLKLSIGAGIGLFIAYIGLQQTGIITQDPTTATTFGNLKKWGVILSLITLLLAFVFYALRLQYAFILAMAISIIIGVILHYAGNIKEEALPSIETQNFDFSKVGKTFLNGWTHIPDVFTHFAGYVAVFTFLFVMFFDMTGTLVGLAEQGKLYDKKGNIKNFQSITLIEGVSTVVGASLGTSNAACYVESSSGISQGAKHGASAIVTSVLFLLVLPLFPITSLFSSAITDPILIVVGALMFTQVLKLEHKDFVTYVGSFLTILIILLSYSISAGIAFGFLYYIAIKTCTGKYKEIPISLYCLVPFFIAYFIFYTIA